MLGKHHNFHEHIERKACNKMIGTIKSLSVRLLRKSSLTIFKYFVQPHLDYCDIIYDK